MFENRVLRRIFGARRYEVSGEWREPHKEEFNNLYYTCECGNEGDRWWALVSVVMKGTGGGHL